MRQIRHLSFPHRLGLIATACLLASGCSTLQDDKIDYRNARQVSTLDVPPDLTQLNNESRYQVPGAVVTASGYQTVQPVPAGTENVASSRVGDVRIERSGELRWLVVDRSADKLWVPVKDFWQENGFLLKVDQQQLGIMETDWAENRAKLPQDFVRATIGKVFESLYSTGERDKFRTRIERNATGGTEIHIAHRGMEEVYSGASNDQTVWQPRKSDPELENEFLRRLMLKLGATEAQAKAALSPVAPVQPAARLSMEGAQPVIRLDDGFDIAWRRVGLSLDRSGFTLEDRNRAEGLYYVRYVADAKGAEEPGFLARLFGADKPTQAPLTYRVVVRAAGTGTTVTVLDAQGKPDSTDSARRIAERLTEDLGR